MSACFRAIVSCSVLFFPIIYILLFRILSSVPTMPTAKITYRPFSYWLSKVIMGWLYSIYLQFS